MKKLRPLATLLVLGLAFSQTAGAEPEVRYQALTVPELTAPELQYSAPQQLRRSSPGIERFTLSAYAGLPLATRDWWYSVTLYYSLDSIDLERLANYGNRLYLHTLNLEQFAEFPLDSRSAISIEVDAMLKGDLNRSSPSNIQPAARAVYAHRIRDHDTFNIGFEASRMFGPLIPYPCFALHVRDAILGLSVRMQLPRYMYAYSILGTRTQLGLVVSLEGSHWWVTQDQVSDALLIQDLQVAPRVLVRLLSWLSVDARIGLIALRRIVLPGDRLTNPDDPSTSLHGPHPYAAVSLPMNF